MIRFPNAQLPNGDIEGFFQPPTGNSSPACSYFPQHNKGSVQSRSVGRARNPPSTVSSTQGGSYLEPLDDGTVLQTPVPLSRKMPVNGYQLTQHMSMVVMRRCRQNAVARKALQREAGRDMANIDTSAASTFPGNLTVHISKST